MEHNFCTLLSRDYLAKGLTLYNSLLDHDKHFTMFIFCMEKESTSILEQMGLKNAVIISMSELETEDRGLLETKDSRSVQEYSWTAKASVMLYILRHYAEIDNIIWLDGDICFFSDAEPIYREWGSSSILLTEEKYTGLYEEKSRIYGKYQLGFMGFRRDETGIACLEQFRRNVLQWCYNRFEEGKWSDQMYAVDWPEKYKNVHIVKHKGINVNPFILYRYVTEQGMKIISGDSRVFIEDEELVLFHFYGFDRYNNREFDLCHYGSFLSDDTLKYVYKPYTEQINKAVAGINSLAEGYCSDEELRSHRIKNYWDLQLQGETAEGITDFCTMASCEYLPKCLALLKSMENVLKDFRLWVCCLDEEVYDALIRLNHENIRPIHARCIGNDEVEGSMKGIGTKAYAYILKGFFLAFLLKNNYNLRKLVYLDSDVFLSADPGWIFEALDSCSVLLFRNRKTETIADKSVLFCAWLIGFRRDKNAFDCIDSLKYNSLWHVRNDVGFDANTYRGIINNWHLKQKGVRVVNDPAAALEPTGRICSKIIRREGKLFFGGKRIMAAHLTREVLDGAAFHLLEDYLKLLDSKESGV